MSAPAAPAPVQALPLGERWRHWRSQIIANPRFQRWAAAFPLTRGVAERNARALFDLCAGFVYSQTLAACVRLDLFAKLADGPRTAEDLAREVGLTPEAATRLLRAAASLKLFVSVPGDRFALADLGAAMLGNPSIAGFVAHHALLYADLADPVALLRGEIETRMSHFWPYAARQPDDPPPPAPSDEDQRAAALYSDLMSRSQALIAEDVLDAFPPRGRRGWLDVGGGEGAFVTAAAARAPELKLMLFDLPPVAARARQTLAARGLTSRVTIFEGDFLADSLPQGAEIVSLVRILHDHDDVSALALLRRARAALPREGSLVIAEPMAKIRGAEPVGDAYFGFYLLAMGRGRARSPAEISALAKAAGFRSARLLKSRRPLLASVIVAEGV